jgi:hypothetical protein
MTLLIIFLAVCLLGVLANRYGQDSRHRVRSAEERYSAQGFEWASRD